jgi:sodium-independent organic anion transporter
MSRFRFSALPSEIEEETDVFTSDDMLEFVPLEERTNHPHQQQHGEDHDDPDPNAQARHPELERSNTSSEPFYADLETMGFGGMHPAWLQRFATAKWFLTALCAFTLAQSMAIQGFVPVVVSSIEKRYGLSSTESGFLVSWFDVVVSVSVLAVAHYGHHAHIPQWLGRAMIALCVGCLVFAFPQFVGERYKPASSLTGAEVCPESGSTGACSANNKGMYGFFIAGQLFIGLASAPLFTLGVTFIDDNVAPAKSPLYIGIFYMFAAVGPAIGFVLGGVFLASWVDPGASTTLTTESSGWVGAWWAGFVLCAGLALLFSPALFVFPFRLPGTQWIRDLRAKAKSQSEKSRMRQHTRERFSSAFFEDMRSLLTNKPFMFTQFGCAAESLVVAGVGTFLPKVVETQFLLSSSQASFLTGVSVIIGAAGGIFLGGWLSKKWSARTNARNAAITIFLSLLCSTVTLIHCAPIDLVGESSPYRLTNNTGGVGALTACSAFCNCSEESYRPVCADSIGKTFKSVCHAGCQAALSTTTFANCTCLDSMGMTVSQGKCRDGCNLLPVFLVVLLFLMLFSFINQVPATTVTLR